MPGLTKPSVVLHDAARAIKARLGQTVPTDPRRGYTDRVEALSATVFISYEKQHEPSDVIKNSILRGAKKAMKVVRQANDVLAGVVILRKKEPAWFTATMDTHFGLIDQDDAGGFLTDNTVNKKFSFASVTKHDRRWVIESIRQKMLSLSMHLNTGIYLIDAGELHRDISGGASSTPKAAHTGNEAYVFKPKVGFDPVTGRANEWKHKVDKQSGNKQYKLAKGMGCGFRNGEIHMEFESMAGYSELSYARVIIHEAVHKFLGIDDIYYAHNPNYSALSLQQTLENTDCYAWAAISLYCKSVKMAHHLNSYDPDWMNCQK